MVRDVENKMAVFTILLNTIVPKCRPVTEVTEDRSHHNDIYKYSHRVEPTTHVFKG